MQQLFPGVWRHNGRLLTKNLVSGVQYSEDIIRLAGTEQRLSMTAKLYQLVAPAIHTTLNRADFHVPKERPKADPKVLEFLRPFVENGKLNALIVLGDPYAHGKYDSGAKEGAHIVDFGIFLGQFLSSLSFPYYKLDTQITDADLQKNLVLIGNIESNTVIEKINDSLPVRFSAGEKMSILSPKNKTQFSDPHHGLIIKTINPFNPEARILVLGGVRTRGMRAAVIAVTCNIDDVFKKIDLSKDISIVVKGIDTNSDNIIDTVRIEEGV